MKTLLLALILLPCLLSAAVNDYEFLRANTSGPATTIRVQPHSNDVLGWNGTTLVNVPRSSLGGGGSGGGSLSSITLTMPSGFTVTGSPLIADGTLAVTLATQLANKVWAGPILGSAAAPTFRSLVAADLPDLSSVYQPFSSVLSTFATNGSAYYLARGNHTGTQAFSTLTGTPTTLAGYGILDAITAATASTTYQVIITTGSLALSKLATDPLARANHTGTQLLSTISDAGALAGLSAVASAQITDGTIVNADIGAAAAIALSKLATDPLARANHTGTQLLATISDAGALAALSVVTTTQISDGTILDVDISATASIALSKLATNPLARSNHTGTQTWSTLTSTPTTLAGYGIVDSITAAVAASTYQPLITDGSLTIARTSGLQTALDAKLASATAASTYQPLSSNLNTYSGITPSANIQSLLGAVDYAAARVQLALGNVENTALSTWIGSANITMLGTVASGSIPTTLLTGTITDAQIAGSISNSKLATDPLNASNLSSGTVSAARLGSGSSIASKFLRGDNTWQTISGGGDALTANPLSQFAATTSAQLLSVLTDESGTGSILTTNGSAASLTSFPTLNQNTTGSAATLTTPRAINGVNFDGSAAITITAAADTLTGTTLANNIVSSSLASVGTITSGTWTATSIAVANGGTGATTQSGARTNLGLGDAAVYNASAGGNGASDADKLAIYRSTGALYASDVVQVMPTSGTFPRIGYNYNRIYFEQTGGSGVLQPTTLTDVWTWFLPNASGTIITTGNLSSITAVGTLASGAVPVSLITGLGTGIATSLAINTGSAGAPVLFNGALGTPSSGTLTSCTVKAEIVVACSDETTSLTTGTAKVTFRMPHAMTLTGVRLQVNTAPTGSVIIVDVREAGATIFSTKPQIATSAFTSVGGAVPGTLSDTALADDAEITINLDQIGSTIAGKGLKITLVGTRQ